MEFCAGSSLCDIMEARRLGSENTKMKARGALWMIEDKKEETEHVLSEEDMAKLGAEAFAFVNVARFAVPLRIGLALSTVPWVQANIIDRFARMRGDATAPEAGPEAAAPEAHWPGTPPPDATVWHAGWDAAAPVEHWQGVVAPTATEAGPEAGWPPAVPPAVPSVSQTPALSPFHVLPSGHGDRERPQRCVAQERELPIPEDRLLREQLGDLSYRLSKKPRR